MLHLVHDGAAAAQGREVVVVEDGGSSFRIKKTTAGGPFIVESFGNAETLRPAFRKFAAGYLYAAYSLHDLPIADLLGSPGLEVKGLEDLGRPGAA